MIYFQILLDSKGICQFVVRVCVCVYVRVCVCERGECEGKKEDESQNKKKMFVCVDDKVNLWGKIRKRSSLH